MFASEKCGPRVGRGRRRGGGGGGQIFRSGETKSWAKIVRCFFSVYGREFAKKSGPTTNSFYHRLSNSAHADNQTLRSNDVAFAIPLNDVLRLTAISKNSCHPTHHLLAASLSDAGPSSFLRQMNDKKQPAPYRASNRFLVSKMFLEKSFSREILFFLAWSACDTRSCGY